MRHGRSRHLIRAIILVAAVVLACILASAVIRYNRSAGWFDADEQRPPKETRPPPLKLGKQNSDLQIHGF